jgi:TraX protein.
MTNILDEYPIISKSGIMNRNTLKYIAILAMVFDHIAVFLLNNYTVGYGICRTIGRLTAPIMCFFIAEGFYYTRSKRKYGIRLVLFALISQLAYTFSNRGTLVTLKLITDWNVIFALFIGFLVLLSYETITIKLVKCLAIIALCCISFISDWGVVAPLWILFFYMYRNNVIKRYILFGSVAIVEITYDICLMSAKQIPLQYGLWHLGLFMVIPLLLTYNGEKGRSGAFNKWIFYIFYPLQFIVFGMLKTVI